MPPAVGDCVDSFHSVLGAVEASVPSSISVSTSSSDHMMVAKDQSKVDNAYSKTKDNGLGG
jgi:hypothetical protein